MGTVSAAEWAREEIFAWDAMLKTAFRTPPYNPESLLAREGINLYDKMMDDAMVRAAINTKRYALLAKPYQVFTATNGMGAKPTAKQLEVRDFVEEALRGMRGADGIGRDFRQVLFQMMSAFYRGFSVGEMVWRVEEQGRWAGKFTLAAIKAKNPKQIGFDVDDFLNVQGIVSWTPTGGTVKVPREKCVLYVYNPQDEMPYGDSDLRGVYKHWWSKDVLHRFWNIALQRFGMPMVFAQVAGAASSGRATEILETLKAMQTDSSAIFPPDVLPQVLQASQAGAAAFSEAVGYHNEQIALGILLQTLTSGEGQRVGSMALGQVHFDILLYVLENARADIEAVVNTQIVRRLVDYNFADASRRNLYPEFSLANANQKDILKLAQAFDVLLTHGVVTGKEQAVRDLFDLPPLDD